MYKLSFTNIFLLFIERSIYFSLHQVYKYIGNTLVNVLCGMAGKFLDHCLLLTKLRLKMKLNSRVWCMHRRANVGDAKEMIKGGKKKRYMS